MKTLKKGYDNPFLTFLQGGNTIIVKNEEQLKELNVLLKGVGLEIKGSYDDTLYTLMSDALRKGEQFDNQLIISCDAGKGITFFSNVKSSFEWYGQVPYTFDFLFEGGKN